MSKQPLEEILEELKAAEVRWQELLKETGSATGNLKKPEILYIGPKPITKESLQHKVAPIVHIPIIKRNRGDFVSRMKLQLKAIKSELGWTDCKARKVELIQRLTETKSNIKAFKKEKKYGKYPNKN